LKESALVDDLSAAAHGIDGHPCGHRSLEVGRNLNDLIASLFQRAEIGSLMLVALASNQFRSRSPAIRLSKPPGDNGQVKLR
jgi:hypothetical protein